MATADISQPLSGNKLYQERARTALPLLVRQAMARTPITYSDLAQELRMPNPRNLNYVLGSIGQTLRLLSKQLGTIIPPIQCLVYNKFTGLPGEGVGMFLNERGFAKLPLNVRKSMVQDALKSIYDFDRWPRVLNALSLNASPSDFSVLLSQVTRRNGGGEGEGTRHKALKEYVARNPASIGLPTTTPPGQVERALPSGDSLDVSFRDKATWVAAEVKSACSDVGDILRGIFQCVKYKAVMEAELLSRDQPRNARAILVLESVLPESLIPLKNLLEVEVIPSVTPSQG